MTNKISKLLKEFIYENEGLDIQEIITDMVGEIPELKQEKFLGGHTLSLDEISLNWLDDYVMGADDYTKQLFYKIVDGLINVVESFEKEV